MEKLPSLYLLLPYNYDPTVPSTASINNLSLKYSPIGSFMITEPYNLYIVDKVLKIDWQWHMENNTVGS